MFFPRHRPARTLTQLFELRKERDAHLAEKRRVFGQRALERVKARYDADPGKPVVWNLLVISGGGDWGAFGAGFIKGWSHVQGPLTKPEFDVVTGVSTGAFPFREIDGSIYVDGGVTVNLLYGGERPAEDTPLTMWTALYPHLPVPTVRFWVIFNNQLRPLPQVTRLAWPAVFTRSLEMATRAATITAIRHLFAEAEIARLKHGGEMSKYSARDYCARVTDENS